MPRPGPAEKAKDLKGTSKKLLAFAKPYYFKITLILALMVISTLLCIYGPKLTGDVTTLLYDGIKSKLTGGLGIDYDAISKIVIILCILYGVSAILDYLVNFISVGVSTDITYRLRKEISEKLNRLPLDFFNRKTNGEILSRVTNDVDNIANNLTSTISQILNSVINIIGVIVMMFIISWKLTLIALVIIPISGGIAALIVKKSQKYFKANSKYMGEINGHIEEIYSGHLVVKAYNYEEEAAKKFDGLNEELYKSAYKSQFYSAVMHPITSFLGNLIYVVVCLVGGFEAIRGSISIGNIQAFLTYIRRLNQPVNSIAQLLNTIQTMAAAAERVFEILDEEEMIPDTLNPVNVYDENGELMVDGAVEFSHVKFGYNPNNIVIHDFSMKVEPGTNVAIVGPTGAGKTTLVKLLMRFFEVNDGSIMIDGHNIIDYKRGDLRNCFGMVLQDTWLFEGTIKENIKFAKPDASDEEVYKVCKMAHVDHFIRTLENGYDTVIQEDSSSISAGQKQLLTIARTFLSDPKILIID